MAHSHGVLRTGASAYRNFSEALYDIARALRALAAGRSNAIGTVTLAQSTTTTVVTDTNVADDSVIALMPTTANAVSADTYWYIATVINGGFTITHDNNAAADRTFKYLIQG